MAAEPVEKVLMSLFFINIIHVVIMIINFRHPAILKSRERERERERERQTDRQRERQRQRERERDVSFYYNLIDSSFTLRLPIDKKC